MPGREGRAWVLGDVRLQMAAMSNAVGPRNVPFVSSGLGQTDPEVAHAIGAEDRQHLERRLDAVLDMDRADHRLGDADLDCSAHGCSW